jgi:hypothetical protein
VFASLAAWTQIVSRRWGLEGFVTVLSYSPKPSARTYLGGRMLVLAVDVGRR